MAGTVSLGAHRLPPAPGASREERLRRNREMLAHALTQGTTVAVVGSGCSIPLGYPSWRDLAAEVVDRSLEALGDGGGAVAETGRHDRLLRFRDRLASGDAVESPELMFMIGACKRIFAGRPIAESPYYLYLTERFRPPAPAPGVEGNPHRALLRLRIQRFVTTNYDCEIERALEAEGKVAWEAFGIADGTAEANDGGSRLSFTQRPENCDQLALFALARVGDHLPDAPNMVFHCHGRFDDPDSIVATEGDYQRWYLAEEAEAAPAFLQTFDLLFTSNPILFVGFGLGDEDLLRPLRRIGAATPERREFRPLFALVPETAPGADWDDHERVFERYGLNVIPFTAPNSGDGTAWGRALSAALAGLETDRLAWHDAWLEKPMLRTVSVRARPPQPYRHYSIDSRGHEILGRDRVAAKLEQLKQQALAGARVIGLVGPGGTGKSWHAMRLLEELQRETAVFEGFFFWSSYYADDWLTGIDRLMGYIDPKGQRPANRLIRLPECLAEGRYLIVLDGIERLLRPIGESEVGKSNEPVTRRLLRIIGEPGSQSTVVLTSRLWPKDLDAELPGIKRHTLERMQTDDVADVEPFAWFDRAQVSALCSLLDGHTYALFLADRFLARGGRRDAEERRLELHRALSDYHPDRRLGTMIDLVVQAVDRETGGFGRALLERLAVFMSPVTEETVQLCFDLATEGDSRRGLAPPTAREVMARLLEGGLLFRVASAPTEREPPAFTIHPTVRTYIFEPAHEVERDVLPNFTLAGFTSARAAVHPGSDATARLVLELFNRLHDRAAAKLAAGETGAAAELCRSLFGVMRSRMETNTVPRWTTYPEYIRLGLRLADLARRISPGLWSFRDRHELAEIEAPEAPLYADELAFVYNDVGLTLCAEGYMQDTLAVWEQGYEINRIIEGTAEVPIYSLQSQLHLGHTFLELGKLPIAEQYLELSARTNRQVQDQDYGGRIRGYQAVISLHHGHLTEADEMFGEALRDLKEAGGNPRAQSFFLNYRAKLAMVVGDLERAEELIRSSYALAANHRFVDLVAYARTVRGRLRREQGDLPEANAEYRSALAEARRLGIRRLEAEVLTGLCRLALVLGDSALARRRAMAALGIANELGLGLRQTLSLRLLGAATMRAGQRRLGKAYLRLARRLGEAQQYRLGTREADRYLRELEEEEDGPS